MGKVLSYKVLSSIILSILFFSSTFCSTKLDKMVVNVSVANLRHKPEDSKNLTYDELDWEQTTQLLFGEKILAGQEKNGWIPVKAIEQKIFYKNRWHNCSGWIKAGEAVLVKKFNKYNLIVKEPWADLDVCIGTKLCGLKRVGGQWVILLPNGEKGLIGSGFVKKYPDKNKKTDLIRESILKTAKKFLGTPYHWGGRSFYNRAHNKKNLLTGVDCSSLVELCYKLEGIDLPRNTISQYKKSIKIKKGLKKADLVFISTHGTPKTIKHVMIYLGDDNFIEAKGNLNGKKIRKVVLTTGQERLGKHINELKSGDKVLEGTVFFGSFLI